MYSLLSCDILPVEGGDIVYLNKEQFELLKKLSSKKNIEYSSLSENEIKIANFLETEKLISIYRESFPKFNQNGQVRYAKGKAISISISEQGKSYIAERNHEFKKLLLKDVAIPIIVSVLTTLALNGLKLLPRLLQLLELHIP